MAFESAASNLVAGDTNRESEVFVHDRQVATTIRVSVNSSGVQGNGESYYPSTLADGRFAAFASEAWKSSWIGEPGRFALLKIVEVNGTSVSVPFASGLFDAAGLWSVGGNVPFGLSGNVVTFRAVGITPIGIVDSTNWETVTFQ